MGDVVDAVKETTAVGFPSYEESSKRAEEYAFNALAHNTYRAYASDWANFLEWAEGVGKVCKFPAEPVPEDWLCAFYAHLAEKGRRVSSIARTHVAISWVHRHFDLADRNPTRGAKARKVLNGIKKSKTVRQDKKKALSPADVKAMIAAMPDSLLGLRDKAILLMGMLGGMRRSEIAALRVSDIQFREEGVAVMIRSSKTDQAGEGFVLGLATSENPDTCPKRTLREWLKLSRRSGDQHLFCGFSGANTIRSDQPIRSELIGRIVKRCVKRIGKDSSIYSAHSLRRGAATAAFDANVPEVLIMRKFRWKSADIMREYIEEKQVFDDSMNMTAKMGF